MGPMVLFTEHSGAGHIPRRPLPLKLSLGDLATLEEQSAAPEVRAFLREAIRRRKNPGTALPWLPVESENHPPRPRREPDLFHAPGLITPAADGKSNSF